MITNAERSKRIEGLTNRQALDIVQFMTAWLDGQRPEPLDLTPDQQVAVLNDVFQKVGYAALPLSAAARPDEHAAGQAGRQLLLVLSKSDDSALLAELDHWLANPPKAETKALVELVVVPIVLTACIIALGTKFKVKYEEGRAVVDLARDPIKGKDLKAIVSGIFGVVKGLIGVA